MRRSYVVCNNRDKYLDEFGKFGYASDANIYPSVGDAIADCNADAGECVLEVLVQLRTIATCYPSTVEGEDDDDE